MFKKNTGEKKMLGKKTHSNIFYVLHNKDFKKTLYYSFGAFFLNEASPY